MEEDRSSFRCSMAMDISSERLGFVQCANLGSCRRKRVTRMRYAPLPVGDKFKFGDRQVGAVGLGTWSWGNKLLWDYDEKNDAAIAELFDEALRCGVGLFDTGNSYGTGKREGRAEQLLGDFSEQTLYRTLADRAVFATKIAPYPWILTRQSFVEECRRSCRRLRRTKIPLAQLHWSTANYFPWQDRILWDGICDAFELGLIETVGLSNYGPQRLEQASSYLFSRGVRVVSCQVQLSLLCRGSLETGLLDLCDSKGINVIGYSPMALGLLSGKYGMAEGKKRLSGFRARVFGDRSLREIQPLLSLLGEIASTRGKTVSETAINWTLCQGCLVIAGAKNAEQGRSNFSAMNWRLSEAEVAELEAEAKKCNFNIIQNIFQTS